VAYHPQEGGWPPMGTIFYLVFMTKKKKKKKKKRFFEEMIFRARVF
jgi:hypothetical protein